MGLTDISYLKTYLLMATFHNRVQKICIGSSHIWDTTHLPNEFLHYKEEKLTVATYPNSFKHYNYILH